MLAFVRGYGPDNYPEETLITEDGRAAGISHRDMAAAVIDEIENPKEIKRRMTVGY